MKRTLTALHTQGTAPGEEIEGIADFGDIFAHFQKPITNYLYFSTRNWEMACDLAQDTFLKAYESLRRGKRLSKEGIGPWLFRIATNTLIDVHRRSKRIVWYPLSLFNEEYGMQVSSLASSVPSDKEEHQSNKGHLTFYEEGNLFENQIAEHDLIARVYDKLPRKLAVCLWLYAQEELPCEQVGAILGISVSAVKMRLKRVRPLARHLYIQSTYEGDGVNSASSFAYETEEREVTMIADGENFEQP